MLSFGRYVNWFMLLWDLYFGNVIHKERLMNVVWWCWLRWLEEYVNDLIDDLLNLLINHGFKRKYVKFMFESILDWLGFWLKRVFEVTYWLEQGFLKKKLDYFVQGCRSRPTLAPAHVTVVFSHENATASIAPGAEIAAPLLSRQIQFLTFQRNFDPFLVQIWKFTISQKL